MAPTATVTRCQEVTLKIEAPQLNDQATSTMKTAALEGGSFWTVTLTRLIYLVPPAAPRFNQLHHDAHRSSFNELLYPKDNHQWHQPDGWQLGGMYVIKKKCCYCFFY